MRQSRQEIAAALAPDGKGPITIQCLDCALDVPGWRVAGVFGIHQTVYANGLFGLEYTITHLPSGISMGPEFATAEDAAGCALELATLCNWARFDPRRIDGEFKASVQRIINRWGGQRPGDPNERLRVDRALGAYRTDLNGFEPKGTA